MKTAITTITLAAAVTSALAQNSSWTLTVTKSYDDCTETSSGLPTVTALTTQTLCGICEDAGFTGFPGGSITVYETVYPIEAPAGGLEDKTYTVTEPCPSGGLERTADHIPQGFVTTTVSCGCPEDTPVPITYPGPALSSAMAKNLPAPANALPTAPPASGPGSAPGSGASSPSSPGSPAGAPNAGSGEAPPSGGSSLSPAEGPVSGGSSLAPAGGSGSSPSEAPAASPASGGSSPPAPEREAAGGSPAAAPYPMSPAGTAVGGSPLGTASPSGGSISNSTVPFLGGAMALEPTMSCMVGLMAVIAAFRFAL